jgi:hypothetical protein
LRAYQQIAAPTDEKEAEGKPKRVRIGPLKKQNAKWHPISTDDEWHAALPAKTSCEAADQLCGKASRIEDRHCRYGDEPKKHDCPATAADPKPAAPTTTDPKKTAKI